MEGKLTISSTEVMEMVESWLHNFFMADVSVTRVETEGYSSSNPLLKVTFTNEEPDAKLGKAERSEDGSETD